MEKYKGYELCYIRDGLAFFTKKKIKDQWGDDWDDVPYEHNSGEPYYDEDDDIVKIYFICDEYSEPYEDFINSPYSVEMINKKNIPWLKAPYNKVEPIYAGTSLEDFIDIILERKGEVFTKIL
jgi:hypothetical protein